MGRSIAARRNLYLGTAFRSAGINGHSPLRLEAKRLWLIVVAEFLIFIPDPTLRQRFCLVWTLMGWTSLNAPLRSGGDYRMQ